SLYAAEKRRRGLVDFADLLDHTARLLATNEPVRAALARPIDQLLIDECQDTNACQLDLLTRLIGMADPSSAPPEGKLFVVGDAKQSIYRFRGAQVEVFRDLCEGLGANRQEFLSTSFRTHRAGAAFVNHLFERLMGPTYVPIDAHRTACPAGGSVEILLATDEGGQPVHDAAGAAAAQAAVTAQRIAEMLHAREKLVWDADGHEWRPVRPGDVAILFARMTNSLHYERELQRRSVPYYVVAGTGFFQQQEVYDLLNGLGAIDNPFDDIALFGALRSGLFGLTDNSLLHLAESCQPPYFDSLARADLSGRLDAGQADALAGALELLGRLHRRKDALGTDRLLQQLLDETGYEATLLSQFQGRRRLSNARRVADLARSASADRVCLADFLSEMRRRVVSESRYEQAAVAGEHEDVVRLMTIHKAKGLEFPVVVVPDLNAGRRASAGRLLLRRDWGLTCKHVADDEADPPDPLSYRLAKRLEDAEALAEDVRRLYVAATRHQDHLIFVGADWRRKDGGLQDSGSYLAQMDEALGLTEALDGGRGKIPYADGRYAAIVRRAAAAEHPAGRDAGAIGQKLLAASASGPELARAIAQAAAAGADLPRVGPIPPRIARVEIAITALNDFAHCPMLYRWRHELRVPGSVEHAPPQRTEGPEEARGAGSLSAATRGTLYHLCMQHLDFRAPQEAGALVRRAAGEMDLPDTADLDAIERSLRDMLSAFRGHELWGRLASARRVFRELDFVMECGPAVLRGQIDLLYADEDEAWHVVDYKSDRVEAQALARHAAPYELQLLLYAAAAARHLHVRPAGATLYFLRPARTVVFDIDAAALSAVESRASALAERLTTARRSGSFDRVRGDRCGACPYDRLCRRLESP
ncbi:MAG TPA: PD-(D/E)XK nuclease family protein, partial [Phycisphaerae bacterium]|nr:PD-(D/E)XK nuclease family protein [Phycisphaerae bacterium]